MFTAYIDDSGTAPNQKVAIATALVVPACKVVRFQAEWDTLAAKWGISDFHASECAVANKRSDFVGWDEPKVKAAFARIRQITKKYGVKAFSLAVHKDDYDAVIPIQDRPMFGQYHYTWAVQNLLSFLDSYACQSGVEHRLEYIFDWIDKKSDRDQKKEIEDALSRSEQTRPGRFADHYSFGKRQDYPGLQCVDLVGWACYRNSLHTFKNTPLVGLQAESYTDFFHHRNGEWLVSIGQTKQHIRESVAGLRNADRNHPIQLRPHIRGLLPTLSRQ